MKLWKSRGSLRPDRCQIDWILDIEPASYCSYPCLLPGAYYNRFPVPARIAGFYLFACSIEPYLIDAQYVALPMPKPYLSLPIDLRIEKAPCFTLLYVS